MNTVELHKIKIGSRIRKDAGDLIPLIQSISEIGLMHPIVVDENFNLIAGFRRLTAYKRLSKKRCQLQFNSIFNDND